MDDKTREILQRPFDKALIKQRIGPAGKRLSYVEVSHYIARLNEAFDHDWSLEILRREQFEEQVIIEVRLSARGIVKAGIGGAVIQRGKHDGKILSLGDTFKTAEADAIKRAARLLGVGAALYLDEVDADESPQREAANTEPSSAPAKGAGRISAAQLNKLKELVSELGSDWRSFRTWVRDNHGVNVEYGTRALGSELIEDLIGRSRRQRAQNMNGRLNGVGGQS